MISWKSKKQNSVTLSTFEAEFIIISLASQKALYLRALLRTMMEPESVKHPTTIHCDNQSRIVLAKSPVIHQRSKHIDIKFQFIHDEINQRSILLKYMETEKNVADVFTKPMIRIRLNTFRKVIVGNWFLTSN